MPRLWRLAAKYPEVHSLLKEVKAFRERYRKERKSMAGHMKWEYCIVPIRCEVNKIHTLLNDYGEEGWQLVQVLLEPQEFTKAPVRIAYMRRPVYGKPGPKAKVQEVSHGGTIEGTSNA